ncbi:MAG: glutaredoxin domain-containing protein [Chloroflexota bacterium]
MPGTETVVYGTSWCPDCIRSRRLLDDKGVAYRWVNIDEDPQGQQFVEQVNRGKRSVPTIVFPDGDILVEPSNARLTAKLSPDARQA